MCRQYYVVSYDLVCDEDNESGTPVFSIRDSMMATLLNTEEFSIKMALFGMVWLLRVRAEMRRCAKCRREEMQQKQQQQQQQLQLRQESLQSSEDHMSASSASTFYTVDTAGPGGTYCEVHGYVPPKEGEWRSDLC